MKLISLLAMLGAAMAVENELIPVCINPRGCGLFCEQPDCYVVSRYLFVFWLKMGWTFEEVADEDAANCYMELVPNKPMGNVSSLLILHEHVPGLMADYHDPTTWKQICELSDVHDDTRTRDEL
ncbi:hypothetical protein C7974DRAFT_17601 [Boeremia exigua]|uniref:uncharacterized protein n=1 Tax=Boeremia exigua TaxID=749465 RepID=UPI001E8D56E8|nr:uncharacterized protein C7974DRAFT_17601 [Boeremia exigua]KAH6644251.1 hypothetical protein C7974DRAFT_17601 [Boeremia exigua]